MSVLGSFNLIINMSFSDKNTVDVRNSEVSVFGSFSFVKCIRIHSVLQIYGRFSEVVGIGKLHCNCFSERSKFV